MAKSKKNIFQETGKRKSAIARINVKTPGNGIIIINKKNINDFFSSKLMIKFVEKPIEISKIEKLDFDMNINVSGGGKIGQANAIRQAIAKSLVKHDETLRSILKESGMLTRDSREKERKKSGQPGARKRFQFSKR